VKPLGVGVTAAIVLAGPPLYSLMEAGSITGTTALTRGLVIAGACTLGATFLQSIIEEFQREAEAKADGTVVHHPGTDGPPSGPPGAGPAAPGANASGTPATSPAPGAAPAGNAGPAAPPAPPAPRGFAGLPGALPVAGPPPTP
jgi:hypothetical protein